MDEETRQEILEAVTEARHALAELWHPTDTIKHRRLDYVLAADNALDKIRNLCTPKVYNPTKTSQNQKANSTTQMKPRG